MSNRHCRYLLLAYLYHTIEWFSREFSMETKKLTISQTKQFQILIRFPQMNSHYFFCKVCIRFLLECKSVVGGLSNVQLPTKGAKGSKNGTYSLRAAESRRRDHNHERIERSFSHFPIILSKNEFLLLLVLLLLLHSPHVIWRKKKGTPFYKCKLSRTLLQTTKIVGF